MTIDDLKNQYLNYLTDYRGRSENTKYAYDFDLTKFISYLASQKISNPQMVSTKIMETYLFELGRVNGLSTVTKARVRSSIKSFFNFLYRKEFITSNPGINLESIKVPEKRPEYLSQEQCSNFIRTIEREARPYYKTRDLTIAKLLLKSGLRRAEIVYLNVSDVDLSKLRLRVKRKGGREEYLIIHHELAEDLRKYLKTINRGENEPLFLSKRRRRLSASSIWHLVKHYSRLAGLNGDVTVHSLRHTFASTLLSKSMPLPYIQALMGHKSSQTTSRYLHFQNTELSKAFNNLSFDEGR